MRYPYPLNEDESGVKTPFENPAGRWVAFTLPYSCGQPFVVVQSCGISDTQIGVRGVLGRNGHFGFVKSMSTNTGTLSVSFSSDGTAYSAFIPDILPRESISLDGLDIHTIKVKSTVDGDRLVVEVH